MVLRKPLLAGQLAPPQQDTLPYPVSPTSPVRVPPAPPEPEIYSPNLHESPAFRLQSLDEAQRSPTKYNPAGMEDEDEDPWADEESGRRYDSVIPDLLQPGAGRLSSEKTRFAEDVPAQLRPGGEGTPRSSFESQDSRSGKETAHSVEPSQRPTPPSQLQSNNPFLNAQHTGGEIRHTNDVDQQSSASIWDEPPAAPRTLQNQKTGESDGEIPIQMTASLSMSDPPFSEFSSSYRPSNLNLNAQYESQNRITSPPSSAAAGKLPQARPHTSEDQPALIPIGPPPPVPAQQDYTGQNPWSDSVSHENHPQNYNDLKPPQNQLPNYNSLQPRASQDLFSDQQRPLNQQTYHQDQQPPSFDDIPNYQVQSAQTFNQADVPQSRPINTNRLSAEDRHGYLSRISPSDADDVGPQLPPRLPTEFPQETPPPQPPRPQPTVQSEEEIALARKQRSEFYQIRQINWLDSTTNNMRQSPILVQNTNGPCPLLALVNAFSLSAPATVDSPLVRALRTREQITLGLLMDAIFDELTSGRRGDSAQDLPDVGNLYRFLVKLHTGMNVNPRFITRSSPPNLMDARNSMLHLPQSINNDRKPGDFEETEEIRLYSTFGIPLIHGWLPPRAHESYHALERSAKTYEDAQNILFREEELDYKLSSEGLTPDEQQMLVDIGSIKNFLSSTATQLTDFGLDVITESLYPGSIAIFFRNDHFNTLYKHPLSNQLLTLVTDAGYATHDEVVWESLVDVSGEGCDFFAGDFRPVGNVAPELSNSSSSRRSSHQNNPHQNQASVDSDGFTIVTPRRTNASHSRDTPETSNDPPQSPSILQEDADLALALQLQEEEDDRARRASNARDSRIPPQHQPGSTMLNPNGRGNSSNPLSQTRSNTDRSTTSTPPSIVTSGRRNRSATSQSHPFPRQGSAQEVRPVIPPRTSRNPGVNRPVDESDDAPPPSYEQAAKGAPYIPPDLNLGHDLNAGPPYANLDPSPSASSIGLGTTPPYDDGRRRRPRVSVAGGSGGAPGGYPGHGQRLQRNMGSPVSASDDRRAREREKDCVVM